MATGVYQNPLYTVPNEAKPRFSTFTLTSFAEITQSAKHWMGKFCISFVLTSFADKILSPVFYSRLVAMLQARSI